MLHGVGKTVFSLKKKKEVCAKAFEGMLPMWTRAPPPSPCPTSHTMLCSLNPQSKLPIYAEEKRTVIFFWGGAGGLSFEDCKPESTRLGLHSWANHNRETKPRLGPRIQREKSQVFTQFTKHKATSAVKSGLRQIKQLKKINVLKPWGTTSSKMALHWGNYLITINNSKSIHTNCFPWKSLEDSSAFSNYWFFW